LVLEVLNDALSFEIKKYTGQNFREYDYSRWTHGPSLKNTRNIHQNKLDIIIFINYAR
jgi:hypothetical protein